MKPHKCHVPNCGKDVARRLLMCQEHWEQVPEGLRTEVLTTYQKGQEKGKVKPSVAYLRAARAAIKSICADYTPSLVLEEEPPRKEVPETATFGKFGDISRFKRKLDPE